MIIIIIDIVVYIPYKLEASPAAPEQQLSCAVSEDQSGAAALDPSRQHFLCLQELTSDLPAADPEWGTGKATFCCGCCSEGFSFRDLWSRPEYQ